MADHCSNCAALRERVEAAESRMASLGDVINQGLRECSSHQQATGLDDDLRPYVRRLVDAAREQGRFWERAAPSPTPEPTTTQEPQQEQSPLRQSLEDAAENAAKLPPWVHELANSREQVRRETYEAPPQQEQLSPLAQALLDGDTETIDDAVYAESRLFPAEAVMNAVTRAVAELLRHQDQQSRQAERQWVLVTLDEVERPTRRCVECRIHREADVLREVRHRLSRPQQGGGGSGG